MSDELMYRSLLILAALASAMVSSPVSAQHVVHLPRQAARLLPDLDADLDFSRLTHAPFVNSLRGGNAWVYTLPGLENGARYVIASSCDTDCSEYTILIYQGDFELVRVTADTPTAIFTMPTTQDGLNRVEVFMETCSVNPCFFAFALARG